jgi:hypothetical protein
MDVRFGKYNVRSSYRMVLFMRVAKELSKYKFSLVEMQKVRRD